MVFHIYTSSLTIIISLTKYPLLFSSITLTPFFTVHILTEIVFMSYIILLLSIFLSPKMSFTPFTIQNCAYRHNAIDTHMFYIQLQYIIHTDTQTFYTYKHTYMCVYREKQTDREETQREHTKENMQDLSFCQVYLLNIISSRIHFSASLTTYLETGKITHETNEWKDNVNCECCMFF